MDLVFTKRAGKSDTLALTRHGRTERIDCPKQRIIPHDMVHYAVEKLLDARGFLGRVAGGEAAALTMAGSPESDGVERLVEVFQGDGWSGGTAPPEELIALYRVTCAARGCPPLDIDPAVVDAIRGRIRSLTSEWDALPIGGSLHLAMEG